MSSYWAGPLQVYAENSRGRLPAYHISEEMLRAALLPEAGDRALELTVRFSDEPDADALARAHFFVGSGFDPQRLAKQGKALRVVHCTSAGIEKYLPLGWLPAGAVLTNSSGVHADKAREFATMALLMLHNLVPHYATSQRAHQWAPRLRPCIADQTVLIYGVGSLGAAVAEAALALGLHVHGIRRSGAPHPRVRTMGRPDDLPRMLPAADFVVITCPATTLTQRVFGAREFALMKRGAGLVNLSRAAVVDHPALVAALRTGHLGGAVLDVFAQEPLAADSELWEVPNLFITPHVSCDDPTSYIARCLQILARNVGHLLRGERLENVVYQNMEY